LPDDRCILGVSSFFIRATSPRDQRAKPVAGQLQVALTCSAAAFFESVEHVDSFPECGHVQDTVLQSRVNPDFANAGANCRHRFPVVGSQSLLDTPQLKPCLGGHHLESVADPLAMTRAKTRPCRARVHYINTYIFLFTVNRMATRAGSA
jgi:hypothetical protein